MKGYKVFNPDWTCRGFQYEVGKTYKMDGKPIPCLRGFHFCESVADCFGYYYFDPQNKVAEVEALGEVAKDCDKSCTNEIRIVREVPWEEMLILANSGHGNTGYCNSGDSNSGNRNSGNRNSGNRNSGYQNSGDWNSGNNNSGAGNTGNRNSGGWNSGNYNSGNFNSGDDNSGHNNSGHRNSGDYNSSNFNSGNCNSGLRNSGNFNSGNDNSGNWNSGNDNSGDWNSGNDNSGNGNSGDWNKTSYSSGFFCTERPKVLFFDKETDWTYETWERSRARSILCLMPKHKCVFMSSFKMTDDEKKAHPEARITGGYNKEVIATDADRQKWWDDLTETDKAQILALPNFNAEKFRIITGIKV